MPWNEEKGQRIEDLHKRKGELSDAERAELAALTSELEGVASAILADDIECKPTLARIEPPDSAGNVENKRSLPAVAGFSQFWLAATYANNLPEGPSPFGALLFLVGILISIPVLTMLISITMRPPNPDALYGALVGTLCAAVPGGLGFLLMAIGWRPIRARVRLIAEGCAVLGKIDYLEVGSKRVKGGYVQFVKTLGYTFRTVDGRETYSKRLSRGIPRPYNLDEVQLGDVVLVVYDPTDTSKSEFDRFDARQADRLRLLREAQAEKPAAVETIRVIPDPLPQINKNQITAPENGSAPAPHEFPSPPRRVRLRGRWYPTILTFFFFAGFATFLCGFASPMIWAGHWFGVDVPGRIAAKEAVRARRGTDYRCTFTFRVGEQDHTITANVEKATYDRLNIEGPVQVRFLPVWPGPSASIEPPAQNPCLPFFLGWVIFCFAISIGTYLPSLRTTIIHRNLVKNGIATLCRVTDKRVSRSHWFTYQVTYWYNATDGTERRGTMTVPMDQYNTLQVGDTVMVLFDPNNTESSVIYRCAKFEVVGMAA